ncbi:MAG: ABC transporter ATP-binding protein [Chitinivibrionales bacterium]|nr:ABC transporter ATP-binding protein [Chitinivibrionales bacterium]
MADVALSHIYKSYDGNPVIADLSLTVKSGEFVTLLGPSGCGKSTMLRMIAGLESIDKGDLYIAGRRYNDIPAQKRRLAMVFQSYALFPHMSVRENILFGLKINKVAPALMEEKFTWAIALFGLTGLERRLPKEISGGQRQRVALARALVLDPDVLLLDEPLSNLDAALRESAMEELKRVHRSVGKTIIYVTHNQVEAMSMSGRIAVLAGGNLEQFAAPQAVYDDPQTLFTAGFIGSPPMNFLTGLLQTRGTETGIATEVGFIILDKERQVRCVASLGKKVIVGIRPQNISYTDHFSARRVSDTSITLKAELFETLGDRNLVVARGAGDTVLRFLMKQDDDILPDRQVGVFIDGRKIHVFDPDTRKSIFK